MTYAKLRIPINAVQWTPVNVRYNCHNITLRNLDTSRGFLLRTDQGDPETEDQFGAGMQEVVAGESGGGTGMAALRFPAGTLVCYVKSINATDILILTCWR